MQAPYTAE